MTCEHALATIGAAVIGIVVGVFLEGLFYRVVCALRGKR